ncbi:MAG: type II secretion system protein, partial [Leucothrix sp.]
IHQVTIQTHQEYFIITFQDVLIPYSSGNHPDQKGFTLIELMVVLIPYSSGNHPDPATSEKRLKISKLHASFLYIKRDIRHLTFIWPDFITIST